MSQQFELNLLDTLEDSPRHRLSFAELRARGLTVIGVAPVPAEPVGAAKACKAQPANLRPNAFAAEGFLEILTQCKRHITRNLPAVAARDMEGMHQLRVALRRLRVALSSFGGDFRNPQLEAIRIRAKSLAARLAPARDLDVFSEELLEPAATANGGHEGFDILRKRAQIARRNAWDEAVRLVTGPEFRIFIGELNGALDGQHGATLYQGQVPPSKSLLAFETPCATLADRMLAHRLKGARKRARNLEDLNDTQRHDLRISLKKLRYTAEFFAPFYERRQVERFVSRLCRMQDVLGALNDVVVARKILDLLIETESVQSRIAPASISFAAGTVYGWHLDRAARMWDDAVDRWKKFSKTDVFWNESENA
ncbi:MAG: CHAD domain-containing protein [Rhizomicrobium sp.]|jgi:CHAD domain-containing protein